MQTIVDIMCGVCNYGLHRLTTGAKNDRRETAVKYHPTSDRAMKRALRLLRHALAYLFMRSIEIELHDNIKASDTCRDDNERINNATARRVLQRELAHARMRLAEFQQPGARKTWDIA